MLFQIMGKAVRHSGGAACQQQLQRHRSADDIGGAHHCSVEPVEADAGALQQPDDAEGGAGAQQGHALGQAANVIGMETIDVLVGPDAFQQQGGVQVRWQGQLHQDTVDGGVVIEGVDQPQQLFLTGFGWQVVGVGDETDFLTVLALVCDIHLGGRIAADQNDSEAGDAQALFAALLDLVGDFAPEIGGNLFAIDQLGFHDVPGGVQRMPQLSHGAGSGKRVGGRRFLTYSNI